MSPISFSPSAAFTAVAQKVATSTAASAPVKTEGWSATLQKGATSLLKGLGDSLLTASRMAQTGVSDFVSTVKSTFSSNSAVQVKPDAGDSKPDMSHLDVVKSGSDDFVDMPPSETRSRAAGFSGGVGVTVGAGAAVLAATGKGGEMLDSVVEMSHAEAVKSGVEILSLKSEVVAKALETAMPTLEVGLSGLTVGLGVYNLAKGLNSAASAAMCVSRSEGLKSAPAALSAIPTTSKADASQVKQMIDDLSFCQKENACRAKDQAVSGAMDVMAGTATLVSAGLTAGIAAPIVAVGAWALGSMVKTAVAIYRGTQSSEAKDVQREQISKRLDEGLKGLQFKAANEIPLSCSDKTMLVALQSVGLVDKNIDIHADLSPKTITVLYGVTSEHLENSFTKETETLRKEDSKIAAGVLNGISAVKSFFGGSSPASAAGVTG